MLNFFQRLFYLILFLNVSILTLNAQSAKNDTIVKLNGERIIVTILNINENTVTYSYPGESMTNTISKNLIAEIDFSSGRKEKFSEKVVINGEKDWEKVILTTLSSDVEGLVKKGDLSFNTKDLGVYTPAKKANEKLQTQMKQEAAKLGAHIVLITPMTSNGVRYTLNGVAFGYK
jgi:hypothetical protein